jgi:hypothetical protein
MLGFRVLPDRKIPAQHDQLFDSNTDSDHRPSTAGSLPVAAELGVENGLSTVRRELVLKGERVSLSKSSSASWNIFNGT